MQKLFVSCLLFVSAGVNGFTTPTSLSDSCHLTSLPPLAAAPDSSRSSINHEGVISRLSFLTASFSAVATVALTPAAAFAKEIDPKLKGTKKDPKFEACLSQCIYDCTKPKGDEQKDRRECLPQCRKECATSKTQLMTGTPIGK